MVALNLLHPCKLSNRPFLGASSARVAPQRASINLRPRPSVQGKAASADGIAEVELHIKAASQAMNTAAQDNRFVDAARHRDHLNDLQLKQRVLLIQQHDARRRKIQHKLGDVIQHKKYNYRGVIFGMHAICEAPEQWIKMMGVDKLQDGRNQPFYNVLVDMRDGPHQTTYVAQENISKPVIVEDPQDPIQHANKHALFSGFDAVQKRYVPKEHLIAQFPDSEPLQESIDERQQF